MRLQTLVCTLNVSLLLLIYSPMHEAFGIVGGTDIPGGVGSVLHLCRERHSFDPGYKQGTSEQRPYCGTAVVFGKRCVLTASHLVYRLDRRPEGAETATDMSTEAILWHGEYSKLDGGTNRLVFDSTKDGAKRFIGKKLVGGLPIKSFVSGVPSPAGMPEIAILEVSEQGADKEFSLPAEDRYRSVKLASSNPRIGTTATLAAYGLNNDSAATGVKQIRASESLNVVTQSKPWRDLLKNDPRKEFLSESWFSIGGWSKESESTETPPTRGAAPGDSGGAVFNANGELVGIASLASPYRLKGADNETNPRPGFGEISSIPFMVLDFLSQSSSDAERNKKQKRYRDLVVQTCGVADGDIPTLNELKEIQAAAADDAGNTVAEGPTDGYDWCSQFAPNPLVCDSDTIELCSELQAACTDIGLAIPLEESPNVFDSQEDWAFEQSTSSAPTPSPEPTLEPAFAPNGAPDSVAISDPATTPEPTPSPDATMYRMSDPTPSPEVSPSSAPTPDAVASPEESPSPESSPELSPEPSPESSPECSGAVEEDIDLADQVDKLGNDDFEIRESAERQLVAYLIKVLCDPTNGTFDEKTKFFDFLDAVGFSERSDPEVEMRLRRIARDPRILPALQDWVSKQTRVSVMMQRLFNVGTKPRRFADYPQIRQILVGSAPPLEAAVTAAPLYWNEDFSVSLFDSVLLTHGFVRTDPITLRTAPTSVRLRYLPLSMDFRLNIDNSQPQWNPDDGLLPDAGATPIMPLLVQPIVTLVSENMLRFELDELLPKRVRAALFTLGFFPSAAMQNRTFTRDIVLYLAFSGIRRDYGCFPVETITDSFSTRILNYLCGAEKPTDPAQSDNRMMQKLIEILRGLPAGVVAPDDGSLFWETRMTNLRTAALSVWRENWLVYEPTP